MRCMKMPRSHCESENVHFVQELAEVDGPFEAPININFRDLLKIELPSLVWNRGDTCPKKMKLTNTGHTVIVSGKWKCERPYLTGGPLLGKYVFSQIHFHWGQDDCKGSEHQICGEGFPLEMHVAHFKTEYLTQECALREKDGMVVVVYLFKLQEEPNQSLKPIINSLSSVKQSSTSQVIDPRPILSLCHPFTDDYFMYWGSVVTSTCAHILMWLICREPFGISKEQVKEFRKIMDSSQQPIYRNSKEIQPVHKRNVFHVNASKHLDEPLLPIRKLIGCYCRGSEDKDNVKHSNDCHCQGTFQNQEDVEGSLIEYVAENHCMKSEGKKVLQSTCFANQTFFVHTTQVQSVSILLKKCGSNPIEKYCHVERLKKMKSEGFQEIKKKNLKLVSQSCCFLPLAEVKKIQNLTESRKIRKNKKFFHSVKAFSQIMQSLESLKNHTFKKLKEIESINQEIKEIKPLCQGTEEKKWIRKIEKVMTGQKRFLIRSSQGCLTEIRKLANDFNLDKFFDAKALPEGNRNQKTWMTANKETTNESMLCYGDYIKGEEILEIEKTSSKYGDINNALHFSSEAEKLIESFFEDIKESEDLKESLRKDLTIKKTKSIYSRQGNSKSVIQENKNYITQKMFTLGNLGNRFFTEVTTEDNNVDENQWTVEKCEEELISTIEVDDTKKDSDNDENVKPEPEEQPLENTEETDVSPTTEAVIPLHRADVGILLSKTTIHKTQASETMIYQDLFFGNEEKILSNLENYSDKGFLSSEHKFLRKKKSKKVCLKKSNVKCRNLKDLMCERLLQALEGEVLMSKRSGSDFSTESTEIQRMIFAKIRQSRKEFWEHKRQSFGLFGLSPKRLHNKANCKKFEGYYIQKKKPKIRRRKSHKSEKIRRKILYDLSSTSKDESQIINKQKWKRVTKAKFKLEIQKTKDSTSESSIENFLVSPDRKRLKLECKKLGEYSSRESSLSFLHHGIYLTDKETRTIITNQENESADIEKTEEQEYSTVKPSVENLSEEKQKFAPETEMVRSRNISRSTTNKSLRASSADSKRSHLISEEPLKQCTSEETLKVTNDDQKTEISTFAEPKLLPKNKSLSNLNNPPSQVTAYPRIQETLNVRRKSCKESFIPRRKLEYPKKIEERLKSVSTKESTREVSKKTPKELLEEKDSKVSNQTAPSSQQSSTKFDCKTGFFATNFSQIDNELLPPNEIQLEEGKKTKRTDEKKFHIGRESPIELGSSLQVNEEFPEILHCTDSNPSFKKTENSLGPDNKDFQISVSYSALKKDLVSRPHSAESLPSQTKTLKRKGKKRPHCSKKNSLHFVRKNSSVFKKLNKAEKPLNFLNLTEEEQLKIISVNVVKYLKEKLKEKKDEAEKDYVKQDISLINTEETLPKVNDPQEKKEKIIEKVPVADKNVDKSSEKEPDKAPAVKKNEKDQKTVKDQKKEKPRQIGVLRKPKVTRTPKVEVQKEKSVATPPKQVHDFIKINKQLAGKSRRLLAPQPKKAEGKIKEKPKPGSRPSTDLSKPKATTPKKLKEETFSVSAEPKEQITSKPPTPKSPRSSQTSPKKIPPRESQLKIPRTYKKPDSNAAAKESDRGSKPTSPAQARKLNQSIKNEPNSGTPPSSSTSQKIPRPKKYLNPNSATAPSSPSQTPPTAQNEDQTPKTNADPPSVNVKTSQLLPCVNMTEIQEENKNDNTFQKELEYFIRLQMCLNNDLPKNLETPLQYDKAKLLLQNQQERGNTTENPNVNYSTQNFDSFIKRIITMETKNLMNCSSTSSELAKEAAKHNVKKLETDGISTKNVSIKTMREAGNFGVEISGLGKEKQEETNSDSSYDCKISITLNTNSKEGDNTVQSYDLENWLEGNSNSQTTCLEGSSSQSTVEKSLAKNQNDGDIPIEMKEKLLEILEGEITREMAIKCGASLVSRRNSKDWLKLKEEESEGNNQSRSTVSSCDNAEIFSQISNTMKQYLTYMKQLPDKESQE